MASEISCKDSLSNKKIVSLKLSISINCFKMKIEDLKPYLKHTKSLIMKRWQLKRTESSRPKVRSK